MRILVTGAAGFIGSHLCDRFTAGGHKVFGVDNLSTGRLENVASEVEFFEGDLVNWDTDAEGATITDGLERAIEDAPLDVIVHCAASYSDRNNWERDHEVNVHGSIAVARLAHQHRARVVYFQTALIYGNNPSVLIGQETVYGFPIPNTMRPNPENSYAISKYAGGQYLRHAGVPLLELRLANIYGPRNLSGPVPTFYKRLSEGQACTVVDSRRDFVYIADLVNLVDQAVRDGATGTYHVSTGRDYAIGQLYDAVVDAMDGYGGPDPTYVDRGADDAPTILLDPSATARDFGWQATTDLDEGVNAAVAWYREHGVTDTYTHLEVRA